MLFVVAGAAPAAVMVMVTVAEGMAHVALSVRMVEKRRRWHWRTPDLVAGAGDDSRNRGMASSLTVRDATATIEAASVIASLPSWCKGVSPCSEGADVAATVA